MKIKAAVKLSIILLLFATNKSSPQKLINFEHLKSNFVKKENKSAYYDNLITSITNTFKQPITNNKKNWIQAFQDAESIFYFDEVVKNAISQALLLPVDELLSLQRTVLVTAYTFYRSEYNHTINRIYEETSDIKSYAIATNYLIKSKFENRDFQFYVANIKTRFPDYNKDPTLISLLYDIANTGFEKFKNKPQLSDLLNHPFQPGKTIVYSFHRKNRLYPGITIIKNPDGTFVKNETGSIFSIKQLALSFSNLPGYIINGNTPEGIYSIVGTYISPTETIGPSPNLLVRSPFEVKPDVFFHNGNNKNNWYENYLSLLPESWKTYFPIFQSYYAGEIGRKLIIVHGSTDDTKYFKNTTYYPLIPTRGCLSSKEIWSEQTGKCLESDQIKLINAFITTRQNKGFLVVIELDDQQKDVTIEEILPFIKSGPQR